MKKIITLFGILLLTLNSYTQVIKIDNTSIIKIGTEDYRSISMGVETLEGGKGKYAFEYWNGGFNFWKPYPTVNFGNYILFLRDDHNIGIGTEGDPEYKLDVAGDIRAYNYPQTSDERLKKNIKPITSSLSIIKLLNGVSYDYDIEKDKYINIDKTKLTPTKLKTVENEKKLKYNKKAWVS